MLPTEYSGISAGKCSPASSASVRWAGFVVVRCRGPVPVAGDGRGDEIHRHPHNRGVTIEERSRSPPFRLTHKAGIVKKMTGLIPPNFVAPRKRNMNSRPRICVEMNGAPFQPGAARCSLTVFALAANIVGDEMSWACRSAQIEAAPFRSYRQKSDLPLRNRP